MKAEGTYAEYQAQLNVHRRAQTVAKRLAMGPEAYRVFQHEHYVKRRNREQAKKEQALTTEVEPHLDQPFLLPWLPLEWVEEKEGEGSMAEPLPCPEVRDLSTNGCCVKKISKVCFMRITTSCLLRHFNVLHAQPKFGFHNIFNNTFRHGFAAR